MCKCNIKEIGGIISLKENIAKLKGPRKIESITNPNTTLIHLILYKYN